MQTRPPPASSNPTSTATAITAPARRDALSQSVDQHRGELKSMFPVPPARAPRRKQGVAAAAVALLLGGFTWWLDPAYHVEPLASEVGQVLDVQLADGSRLVLDTDTALEVQWHVRSRQVVLTHGRAHFDVAHSAWRPFQVDAGAAQVRVLGTRFDVWRQAASTEVTLYRGKVAVWRTGQLAGDGVELLPGQQVTVGAVDGRDPNGTDAALSIHPTPATSSDAWTHGRLVFNDTPLLQVIASLQRYRRQPLRLADARLGTLGLSGVFEIANTDQLLAMLPGTLPVTVRTTKDGATEIGPR